MPHGFARGHGCPAVQDRRAGEHELLNVREVALHDPALREVEAHAFPDQVERSSTGCWLPRGDSPPSAWRTLGANDADIALVRRLESLLAAECQLPAAHGEPMQVLRYQPGQRYDVHPDFFDPFDGASLANGGQRLLSCLVYLSTVPPQLGGATYFQRDLFLANIFLSS